MNVQPQTWIEKEARKILKICQNRDQIILKTGYGPSSTPHIGTVMEVVRTCMIAKFLRTITHKAVTVVSFVDDMDGMRKLPPSLPNHEMLQNYLEVPLYMVPDPNGQFKSLADYAVNQLKDFFRNLGYSYYEYTPQGKIDFANLNPNNADIVILCSHAVYGSGAFDHVVLFLLDHYQDLLDIILPTLGAERQATYSPFMPISPKTGKVLAEAVVGYLKEKGSILLKEDGEEYEIKVTGGSCKMQWKFDFVAQWIGMNVAYEMSGKDIGIGTLPIALEVFKKLHKVPPITMTYELFLDAYGKRISKTKSNGIEVQQFFRYLMPEGTKHMMFSYPQSARRVDMAKMPTYLDAFLDDLQSYDSARETQSPIWYINAEQMAPSSISASMALGMIQGFQLKDLNLLLQSIEQRSPLNQTEKRVIEAMYHFYHEQYAKPIVMPAPEWLKKYVERIVASLDQDESELKELLYNLGKDAVQQGYISSLRDWFEIFYRCLFGYESGPRLHTFFHKYGKENSKKMLFRLL